MTEQNAHEPMTVEYLGGEGIAAESTYLGAQLPPHEKAGDTFEIEAWRAYSLTHFHPTVYRLAREG